MDLLSIFTVLEYQIITLISDAIGMGVESAIGMGVESAFSISLVLITRNIVIRRVLQVRTCTRRLRRLRDVRLRRLRDVAPNFFVNALIILAATSRFYSKF